MVLFPEGGFLRKRREASQRYGEKLGLPYVQNVTLPRTGAMQAIMDVLPARTSQGNNNGASKRYENGNLLTVTSEGKLFTVDFLNQCFLIRNFTVLLSDQILKYQNKKDDEQQPFLDYVLDITVAYPQGKPLDLPTIVTGMRDPCQTYFYYRLYHSSEVIHC